MSARDDTEDWLRHLERALSELPAPRRADIVQETRAHLYGRGTDGLGARDALNGFGSPEDYARAFVEDFRAASAANSKTVVGTGSTTQALRRVAFSLLAIVAVSISTFAAGAILVVAASQADSSSPGRFAFSVANVPADSTHPAQHTISFGSAAAGEIHVVDLGLWFLPLALLLLVGLWKVGRLALRVAAQYSGGG